MFAGFTKDWSHQLHLAACEARAASSWPRWRGWTTSASRRARTSTRPDGALKNTNVRLLDEAAAAALVEAVRANVPWQVTSVEPKPGVERPAPPFTTSTLTQEASRKLGFSTERTMQVAQRLFQGVDLGDGEMKASSPITAPTRRRCRDKAPHRVGAGDLAILFGDEYYKGPRRYRRT